MKLGDIFWRGIKDHNSTLKKVFKSEIKLGLSFLVPDLVHEFQMICIKETLVIERKPNAGCMDMGKA